MAELKLATSPLLYNLTGLTKNSVVTVSVRMTTEGRLQGVDKTFSFNLRVNRDGKVENYDVSPIVCEFIRQTFSANVEKMIAGSVMKGANLYGCVVTYGTARAIFGPLLFGVGSVEAAQLSPPYLLRRNTAPLHFYDGLPGTLSQFGAIESKVLDESFIMVTDIKAGQNGYITQYQHQNFGLAPGDYYIVANSGVKQSTWNDSRVWSDADVWHDYLFDLKPDAVIYPLRLHPSPADCIRAGAKIYVRYWNSRGAWSYTLLDVLYNELQAKTTYADAWRLDDTPVDGRIYGDRVQTDKEMTYSITAGRDGLDRLDVDELRDMQRSYCVQVWDIDREAWRDCYVKDATTRNAGGRGQEMTFTLEMPHEYTFTR